MDIEFFQLKGYVGSCAGQFQAGCSSWIFPGSVCSTVSHFAMKTKSLSIHGILRLQKWECQQLETLIRFFPTGEGVLSVECGIDCQEHGWGDV